VTIPLSSWNATATRQAILDFVSTVTDDEHANYIPPPERIADFDNDGTLWCERPLYFQFAGAFDFLKDLAVADPKLRDQQPYKAAYANDLAWFSRYASNDMIPQLVGMLLHAADGETQDEFEVRALRWLQDARHPRFDRLYTELTYKPMVELLDYLQAHDFHVYICSGGGMDYRVPRINARKCEIASLHLWSHVTVRQPESAITALLAEASLLR